MWKMLVSRADSHQSAAPPHDGSHHVSPKKQGRMSRQGFDRLNHQLDNQWEYTAKWQTNKPYKAMESVKYDLPRCTVVSDQDDVSTGGAKQPTKKRTDPD